MEYTTTRVIKMTVIDIFFDAPGAEEADKICDNIIKKNHKGKKCKKECVAMGGSGTRYYYAITIIESSQKMPKE